MDCILVFPRLDWIPFAVSSEEDENIGIGYIAAYLRREGFSADVIVGEDTERIAKVSLRKNPLVLGISVMHYNFNTTLRLIKLLRPHFRGHITLGGYLPTAIPEKLLFDFPEIDSVIVGEGEITTLELIVALKKKLPLDGILGLVFRKQSRIVKNPPRPAIENLDMLPNPVRPHIKERTYISFSRGCFGNCSFCVGKTWRRLVPGKAWRSRSPEKVVNEMEELTEIGAKSFRFADPEFIGPATKNLAEEMIRRGIKTRYAIHCPPQDVEPELFSLLRRSGLEEVHMGFEAVTKQTLRAFRRSYDEDGIRRAIKILESLGISISFTFIMFNPWTTPDEIRKNIQFLKEFHRYASAYSWCSYLIPFPGTEFYEKLDVKNPYNPTFDFDDDRTYTIYKLVTEYMMNTKDLHPGLHKYLLPFHLELLEKITDGVLCGETLKSLIGMVRKATKFSRNIWLKMSY